MMNSLSLLRLSALAGLFFFGCSAFADMPLQPLMCIQDKVVQHDDFSTPGPLDKKQWEARQGTQWKIEDGVLRGHPSTPEFQASVPNHKGTEPRIAAPSTPPQFIARFSVRFTGGKESEVAPFVEFGHHVCRLHLTANGAQLLAGPDATIVAEAKNFHYEAGKWYQMLAEMQGQDFVLQIAGGPTIYARNEIFAKPAGSGASGVGVCGPNGGVVEIDDVTLASVKPGTLPGWESKRAAFPSFSPIAGAKKGKKAAE